MTHTSHTTTTHHYQSYRQPQPQAYSSPERHPRTATYDVLDVDGPWQQMTHTFTWVAEQEFMKGSKRGLKTEDWVKEQQVFSNSRESPYRVPRSRENKARGQKWEEVIYVYEVEADQWMKDEERARRVAIEREKARARIQVELKRIEARYEAKREAERREREEARCRAHVEAREKERRNRAKLNKIILDAWTDYETRWTSLTTSSEALDFKTTPWPIIVPPRNPDDITRDAIVAFLFSPLHSQNQSRKDRIRSAQLRWHPDRFLRLSGRVVDADKAAVEEGVGIVARCLNDLMEKEKSTKM
ncbi:hypothetical protein B0H34DRAFT_699749 [Crassisporium funariophilum]|nr:hypothetical protein B0H34DRAFT_699749 [Crassisporium funariophilum]